jgi:hypothetical protein
MAYFFKCTICKYKEIFGDTFKMPLEVLEGELQDYESVICDSCATKQKKLKGNQIIIQKGTNNANI